MSNPEIHAFADVVAQGASQHESYFDVACTAPCCTIRARPHWYGMMPDAHPLLTRRIARRLKGTDNAALRYLHGQDAPSTTEPPMYRVVGRVRCRNVYRDADSRGRIAGVLGACMAGQARPMGVQVAACMGTDDERQWAASLREGTLVDVTARVYKANSKGVHLWREARCLTKPSACRTTSVAPIC